jgi:hypothetical protein
MYKLIRATVHEGTRRLPFCDHCGHSIRVLCEIEHAETGQRMTVGTDCVRSFVSPPQAETAERVAKRYQRAARQWRSKMPLPLEGETREQYIARRVSEMGNALPAGREWMHWAAKSVPDRCFRINARARRWFGLGYQHNPYYWPFDYPVINSRKHQRIERKYGANRFDYTRPMWELKLI